MFNECVVPRAEQNHHYCSEYYSFEGSPLLPALSMVNPKIFKTFEQPLAWRSVGSLQNCIVVVNSISFYSIYEIFCVEVYNSYFSDIGVSANGV